MEMYVEKEILDKIDQAVSTDLIVNWHYAYSKYMYLYANVFS